MASSEAAEKWLQTFKQTGPALFHNNWLTDLKRAFDAGRAADFAYFMEGAKVLGLPDGDYSPHEILVKLSAMGERRGAASRQAEIDALHGRIKIIETERVQAMDSDTERQRENYALQAELAELRAPMKCGHPGACGAIRKLALSEIPGNLLNDGITEVSEGYCLWCADIEQSKQIESCGHPIQCQIGDEYGHFTCSWCAETERLREALESIAKNTCCDSCQEAALVAEAALAPGGKK